MIRFMSVTKDFGVSAPALENVSFEVEKGEFVFLTGHSGSGKSTLLKLITREYIPTEGEIEFESQPLTKLRGSKIHHHRRRIGVVFQDYRLLPELNVWENIALPLEITGRPRHEIEERVTDLLELVQLADRPYAFPAQLSGGEAQRVGIARALASAPSVILADEPTGNLDPQNTQMISKLFHKINELGTTIFFATHDPSIVSAFGHRRIHLEKGKIIEDTGKKVSKTKGETPKAEEKEEKTEKETKETKEKTPPKSETPKKEKTSEPKSETKKESDTKEKHKEPEVKAEEKTKELKPNEKKKVSLPKLSMPFGKKKALVTETVVEVENLD